MFVGVVLNSLLYNADSLLMIHCVNMLPTFARVFNALGNRFDQFVITIFLTNVVFANVRL